MTDGHAKYCHDSVADKTFNMSFIFGDDAGDVGKDVAHDCLDLFWIKALGHGRVAGQIRKQYRDLLALAGDTSQALLWQVLSVRAYPHSLQNLESFGVSRWHCGAFHLKPPSQKAKLIGGTRRKEQSIYSIELKIVSILQESIFIENIRSLGALYTSSAYSHAIGPPLSEALIQGASIPTLTRLQFEIAALNHHILGKVKNTKSWCATKAQITSG